jgi:hypothetical protein
MTNNNEFIRDEDGCLWDVRQVETYEAALLMCEQSASLYAEWSDKQKVRFQLFQHRLCMPLDMFHGAIEKVLSRPVYTHEFGLNYVGLQQEFLGIKNAPTLEEIIDLIPEEKRIIIQL